MTHLDLLGSGREADVYALDHHRVLRRYRNGSDAAPEAQLMRHVAAHGFPVPRVGHAQGTDMIMERLHGTTMTEAFAAGRMGVAEGAVLMAALHRRLHEIPARAARQPGDRILHRDLHPDNVMLTSRGAVVIDWHNAAEGPPGLDLALTAIILAQAAADEAHPHTRAAAACLAEFLVRAGEELRSGLDEALAVRSADPNLTAAEAGRLTTVVPALIRGSHPR